MGSKLTVKLPTHRTDNDAQKPLLLKHLRKSDLHNKSYKSYEISLSHRATLPSTPFTRLRATTRTPTEPAKMSLLAAHLDHIAYSCEGIDSLPYVPSHLPLPTPNPD